jgi:hypothetical protein
MRPTPPTNDEIAAALEEVAALLEAQEASPFRVRAYREGAKTVRSLDGPVTDLVAEGGRKSLEALPGIGRSLSAALEEMVRTGRLRIHERLMGESPAEDLFTLVPGIGERLAHVLRDELGVDSLEDLEVAAHDGRLERIRGFGERRVRAVRDHLAVVLSRSARRRAERAEAGAGSPAPAPDVATILALDERYRAAAAAGRLRKIAPRRFNPTGAAWLPVLHADEGGWHWSVLFSNTARAHELRKTDDWVVLFAERDGDERHWTVVTETRGPLAGRRVVRGRESECEALVRAAPPPAT